MYNEDWIQFLKQSLVPAYERLKSDTESLRVQQTLKKYKLAMRFLFFTQMPLNLTHRTFKLEQFMLFYETR